MNISCEELDQARNMRIQGDTYKEISEFLKVSVSSVRRLLIPGETDKDRIYRSSNSGRIRVTGQRYRKQNDLRQKERHRSYYLKNKVRISNRNKEYRERHLEDCRKYQSQYHRDNREDINLYCKEKRSSDPNYRLRASLRTRMWAALKGNYKTGSAVGDLGCSITKLKQHLESLFKDGMSWNNYGEWHIDHIKPLASFDLTDRKQFLEACNFNNLQPLWAKDNLKKGKKRIKLEEQNVS